MSVWPATLPPPLAEGWQATPPAYFQRTPMEAGPPKTRRVSLATRQRETLTFRCTQTQADALLTFFRTAGALDFSFPHPLWGTVQANFEEPPRVVAKKPRYLVTVTLGVQR